jgi:hypothetical protein
MVPRLPRRTAGGHGRDVLVIVDVVVVVEMVLWAMHNIIVAVVIIRRLSPFP